MPDSELTPEAIAQAAQEPASASSDGQSASAVSIPDQIAAAKFEAANRVNAQGKRAGLKLRRVIPPGAS